MTDEEREQAEAWVFKHICFDGLEHHWGSEPFKECVYSYLAGMKSMRKERDAFALALRKALKAGVFFEKEQLKRDIANVLAQAGVKLD